MKGFGKKIRYFRKSKKITQEQLGEKLGVGKSYISKVEAEKTIPKAEFFVKVSEILEVPLDDLFDNKKEPPTELKEVGAEWIILGEELEKEGITPEQVKQWVEIVKKFSQNK